MASIIGGPLESLMGPCAPWVGVGQGGAESVSCRKMNYCNALAGSIATAKCRGKNRSLVHRIASTKISLLQAMNLQLDVNFCPDLLEYAAVSPMDRSLGSILVGRSDENHRNSAPLL